MPATILVVDDDPDVLKLVSYILTTKGYDVITASGADGAISKLKRLNRPLHLLLTDVIMPGLSGPMLADQVTQISPNVPVLFMSGYNDRPVVRHYVTGKGSALLPKPFTADQLTSKVASMLEHLDTPAESSSSPTENGPAPGV